MPHALTKEIFPDSLRNTGKVVSVTYNRDSGDACFRSLLTPHSART
ncbi:hypothetical protein G7B40_040855 [Aetokthonos hydrillicola Thurmond2011]|uniref:Uncharacterized protein n=1 Tax=Aetokthonos hydrillicola Thurmond2011 TaxID=2712845 RepID=A0AAP5IGA8_9CYAN|nr:hypothetical protein [Aetokthonos hydrillicola CCALA 1050]MDR9900839.1 hypothetical protein [Aetokthonos hydrillicola Thurmond2011]